MQKAKVTIELRKNYKRNVVLDYPLAPFNHKSIIEHLSKFRDRFVLHLDVNGPFAIPERGHPTLIMDSFFVASDCFLVQQYPATILFSAITVETVLNHDSRMYRFKKQNNKKWLNLTKGVLLKAQDLGIDISDLVEKTNGEYTSDFITLRNKIAHGDMSGYTNHFLAKVKDRKNWKEITEARGIGEKQALRHLKKCFNFVKKWGMSKPIIILDENEQILFR